MDKKPEYRGDIMGWTCPEGYAHPKCPGCGHNYYDSKPQPKNADGSASDGGKCQWCIEEES